MATFKLTLILNFVKEDSVDQKVAQKGLLYGCHSRRETD